MDYRYLLYISGAAPAYKCDRTPYEEEFFLFMFLFSNVSVCGKKWEKNYLIKLLACKLNYLSMLL